ASPIAGFLLMASASAVPLAQVVQKGDQDKEAAQKFVDSFSEPIRIGESKPVNVNEAQFVAVAQTNWRPAKPDKTFPMVAPIEIQFHITNLSKGDVLFPTFDTFGIRILTEDGKELKPQSKRNAAVGT